MAVTVEQIKPILWALGPTFALSYLPALYRILFTRSPVAKRPLPAHVARVLNILFIPIISFVLLSFPTFEPENIYKVTKAKHFLAPTSDIFDRLSDIRSPLTETDFLLKGEFTKKECRLIYPVYGPEALASCEWCRCNDSKTYFSYSISTILLPHLLNAMVLGIVTGMAGREGARWRTMSTVLSVLVTGADVARLWGFDVKENEGKIYVAGVEFLFWHLRTQRFVSLAVLDAVIYVLLWTTATNRFLAQPPDISERLEELTRGQEMVLQNMTSIVGMRNTVVRDPVLRNAATDYWTREEEEMQAVLEQPDVIEGLKEALTQAPVEDINTFANQTSGAFLAQVDGMRQRRAAASAAR